MSDRNGLAQCCRCKHKHTEHDRMPKPDPKCNGLENMVCPRCAAHSYYDVTPVIAWCWASGLIEIGETCPEGAIKFAHGPKVHLESILSVLARHGYDDVNARKFLVPGVPEAENQRAAGDALKAFVAWSAKSRTAKKYGVVFSFQEV